MTPTALVIQHFPADAAYAIEDHLQARGIDVRMIRLFDGDELPVDLDGIHGFVVLGGPVTAAQDGEGWPTLGQELDLIREAHNRSIPTLGVCLGAQMIARAAGATVRPGESGKEVGWRPLTFTPAGQKYFGITEETAMAFQWHGDTFDIPADAELLADNDRYAQIFVWGSCLAVQPHFEVNSMAAVDAFIGAFPEEADLAGGADRIREMSSELFDETSPLSHRVLGGFAATVVGS